MCKAIRQDLDNFDSDKKTYRNDIEFLNTIKIHKSLSRENKTSLGDFISVEDIDNSCNNLESWKQILLTKIEKLNQNNINLKRTIDGMSQSYKGTQIQKENLINLLKSYYNQIETIGKKSGIFDPSESSGTRGSKVSEKEFGGKESSQMTNSLERVGQIFNEAKELYEDYISICKRDFVKLSKINTALGKNEGERIKTLKMYEMFKKEYKFFQTPKQLPKCYNESILEMKRRIKFQKFMGYALGKLRSLCEYENKKRDEFLEKNGLYMSKEMIPQLGNKAPLIKWLPNEFSSDEYPESLLTENDKKIAGIDCEVYYFQKVFSDMVKNCEFTIASSNKLLDREVEEYRKKIKEMKNQHEADLIKLLEPYKQETQSLTQEKNQIHTLLDEIKSSYEKLQKEANLFKEQHQECGDFKVLQERFEALK
jgi:DNA-binding transcriptional MerR regulator